MTAELNNPDVPGIGKEIYDELNGRLNWLISKAHSSFTTLLLEIFKAEGITELKAADGNVLLPLWRSDGQSMKQLTQLSLLDKATLTALIDRMEKSGLVERRIDPADRRSFRIYLTERGREIQPIYARVSTERDRMLTNGISETDVETCKAVLRKIVVNARKDVTNPEHLLGYPNI